MTQKRTDLAKNLGVKISEQMKKAGVPDRFATGAAPDRREQRKLDQARGLVPFAVKIDGELAKQLRELAESRQTDLNSLVGELLQKGLQTKD